MTRKLLSSGVRDSIRSLHGILPHPDLHSIWSDRHHLLGQFLAEPQCDTGQGGPRCHHRAHHDHPHVVNQRSATQDFLRQINRRLLGNLLRHGLRIVAWQVSYTVMGILNPLARQMFDFGFQLITLGAKRHNSLNRQFTNPR